MNEVIRVLLIDGDEAMMEEFSQISSNGEGIMVIGKVRGIREDLAKINRLSPDVIVLTDTRIPGMEFIDTILTVCEARLPARVIMMAENHIRYLGLAIKAGVAALMPRNTSHDDLVSAIRKIHLWSRASCLPRQNLQAGMWPRYKGN